MEPDPITAAHQFLSQWYFDFESSFFSLVRTRVGDSSYPWVEKYWNVDDLGFERGFFDFIMDAMAAKQDLFFSALTFTRPIRSNDVVVPQSNRLYADLDDAGRVLPELVANGVVPRPTWLWETSPGMWQAGWELSERVDAHRQAELNRALTYATGADKGGWHASKLLRVPGSYNAKRSCWAGEAVRELSKPRSPKDFPPPEIPVATYLPVDDWAPPSSGEWADAVRRAVYERLVPEHLIASLFTPTTDRSLKLWVMARDLADAGVDKQLALTLLWGSSFNKWRHKPDTFVKQLAKAFDRG